MVHRWSAIRGLTIDIVSPATPRQIVGGRLIGALAGLAICQYQEESAFYLFGCDCDWKVVTDTWHQSIEDAKAQAEFEYEGVEKTWIFVN
jgi:hypothetical protein